MVDPCTAIAIYQLPGANALQVAGAVQAKMETLSKAFPEGLNFDIPFDTTKFVTASIEEVYETLIVAVLLVVLVIFISCRIGVPRSFPVWPSRSRSSAPLP